MAVRARVLVWLHGEVKTPPFSRQSRLETGYLLRRLQQGEKLGLPQSRPMPALGVRCHELRVRDEDHNWRLFYRLDPDAVVILGVYEKRTEKTPKGVLEACRARVARYDRDAKGDR
jgi:phage-related protein